LKALFREPLVHFLALGALLFLFFQWKGGGSGPGSRHIAITPGLVEHLSSAFTKVWQRPPTEPELKGLIDEYVKEEMAVREAAALGLDRDDTVIRRRLRQKVEFLIEDAVEQAPATDAELQAWLDRNGSALRGEPQVALRQVYVRTGGAAGQAQAQTLLERLRAQAPGARTDELGDASMLPPELPLGPLSEVANTFGSGFAARVEALPAGQWSGPVESSYGWHLVLVVERTAAVKPALADVRPAVEREVQTERRRAQLQALYERLLKKYTVVIEMPRDQAADAAARPAPAGSGR